MATKDSPSYPKLLSTLVEFNQMWAKHAPVLAIAVSRLSFARSGQPNRNAFYDTGAAVAHLTMEASAPAATRSGGPMIDRAAERDSLARTLVAIVRYRVLLKHLVAKDLKLKYRGSILGFLWSLLNPLLMLGVYTLAFREFLGMRWPNLTTGADFSLMIFSGMIVHTLMAECIIRGPTVIVSQTNLQQQETTLKQRLSKRNDPYLDNADIVVTDPLPEPRESDVPEFSKAIETAMGNRPELREAQNNLQNQNIAIRYTQNNLLPSTSVFGLYAGSGLQGNTTTNRSGAVASLGQTFGAVYPEGAYGALFSASIRTRVAQADNLRAQLERNQLEVGLQSTRNQIELQVQQARIGLIQGRAQIEAAHEAVVLAQQSRDAERVKLRYGTSTPYNVVLKERDLVSAQYAEVQVQSAYAKAVVAMDQATGTTLERNGIRLEDALSGTVTQKPTPPLALPAIPDPKGGAK